VREQTSSTPPAARGAREKSRTGLCGREEPPHPKPSCPGLLQPDRRGRKNGGQKRRERRNPSAVYPRTNVGPPTHPREKKKLYQPTNGGFARRTLEEDTGNTPEKQKGNQLLSVEFTNTYKPGTRGTPSTVLPKHPPQKVNETRSYDQATGQKRGNTGRTPNNNPRGKPQRTQKTKKRVGSRDLIRGGERANPPPLAERYMERKPPEAKMAVRERPGREGTTTQTPPSSSPTTPPQRRSLADSSQKREKRRQKNQRAPKKPSHLKTRQKRKKARGNVTSSTGPTPPSRALTSADLARGENRKREPKQSTPKIVHQFLNSIQKKKKERVSPNGTSLKERGGDPCLSGLPTREEGGKKRGS